MKIVPINRADVSSCRTIYSKAVMAVDETIYNSQQKAMWAKFSASSEFLQFLFCGHACGIEENHTLVGFSSATHQGHIQSLYVHPESQGKGASTLLLQQILNRFPDEKTLTVEASKVSMPIFKRLGFSIIEEEVVDRGGVAIERFRMKR